MLLIPLQPLPNQSFTVTQDQNTYDFILRETNGCMSVTISINGVLVVENTRCVAGGLLIPYRYLENGNFMFAGANQDYPYYTEFGTAQNLFYISPEELAAARVVPPPPIKKSYFDPLGALPLRFAPQGYVEV